MAKTEILSELWEVINDRVTRPPEHSYVSRLIHDEKGIDKVLEKVGEEAVEFILAVKGGVAQRTVSEAADLIFHTLVALRAADLELDAVFEELERRRR